MAWGLGPQGSLPGEVLVVVETSLQEQVLVLIASVGAEHGWVLIGCLALLQGALKALLQGRRFGVPLPDHCLPHLRRRQQRHSVECRGRQRL